MNGVSDLLSDLQHAGLSVRVEAGDIVIQGPKAALTAELLAAVKAHKPALVLHLQAKDFLTERHAIHEALGVQEDQPGDYDH